MVGGFKEILLEPLCRVGVRTGKSTEQGEPYQGMKGQDHARTDVVPVETGNGSQMAVLETFGQKAILTISH